MSKLEVAFAAWIAFHAKVGVDIEATLMPPATEAGIQAVENEIGFRLPEDLRQLYKIANGQFDSYDHAAELEERMAPGEPWAPLFGYYAFLPLEKALSRHLDALEWKRSEQEFNEKYYKANPDQTFHPNIWQVREGDPVDPLGWNARWFNFAESNADSYAVDMNPPRGGTPGQIVEHGSDVARLSVVASSLTDLLQDAAQRLDPSEQNRYQHSDPDRDYRPTIYFDMDWRNTPYDERAYQASIPQIPAEYQAWEEEVEQRREVERQRFTAWLKEHDLDDQEIAQMQAFSEMDMALDQLPPEHVVAAMQAFAQSQGQSMVVDEPVPDEATIERATWFGYYMSLAGAVISSNTEYGKHISSTVGHGLQRQQAIALYHRYKLEIGQWKQSDYEIAEQLKVRFGELELIKQGQTDSYSMQIDQTILSVCHTTFDPDTYKSEEHCEKIDMAQYRR